MISTSFAPSTELSKFADTVTVTVTATVTVTVKPFVASVLVRLRVASIADDDKL
jgi:hypothetical protein